MTLCDWKNGGQQSVHWSPYPFDARDSPSYKAVEYELLSSTAVDNIVIRLDQDLYTRVRKACADYDVGAQAEADGRAMRQQLTEAGGGCRHMAPGTPALVRRFDRWHRAEARMCDGRHVFMRLIDVDKTVCLERRDVRVLALTLRYAEMVPMALRRVPHLVHAFRLGMSLWPASQCVADELADLKDIVVGSVLALVCKHPDSGRYCVDFYNLRDKYYLSVRWAELGKLVANAAPAPAAGRAPRAGDHANDRGNMGMSRFVPFTGFSACVCIACTRDSENFETASPAYYIYVYKFIPRLPRLLSNIYIGKPLHRRAVRPLIHVRWRSRVAATPPSSPSSHHSLAAVVKLEAAVAGPACSSAFSATMPPPGFEPLRYVECETGGGATPGPGRRSAGTVSPPPPPTWK